MPNLSVHIAGIQFPNPVLVSAGTFGFGDEFAGIIDVNLLGGIVTKTITLQPRPGNPAPRVIPVTGGMFNSVGLQNPGVDEFISHKFPQLKTLLNIPLVVSIMGESVEEFVQLIDKLNTCHPISAIELNLSCPNVHAGGSSFGISAKMTAEVVSTAKKASKFPVYAKLTPNVTEIGEIASAAESAGASAIVAVNTFNGMVIDVHTRKSKLGHWKGGISGPGIKPLAVYQVYQIAQAVKIPIIGMGGILHAEDAIEFILAGASAVSVGTGNFIAPDTALKVLWGLESFMQSENITDIANIRGTFQK